MSDVSLVAQTETRNGISFFRARLRFAIETNVRELNYSRRMTGEFSTRRHSTSLYFRSNRFLWPASLIAMEKSHVVSPPGRDLAPSPGALLHSS